MLHFLQTTSKSKPTLGFHICLRSHLQEFIILAFPTSALPLVQIWVMEYNNILTSNKREIFIPFEMNALSAKENKHIKSVNVSTVIGNGELRKQKASVKSGEEKEKRSLANWWHFCCKRMWGKAPKLVRKSKTDVCSVWPSYCFSCVISNHSFDFAVTKDYFSRQFGLAAKQRNKQCYS